MVALLVGWLGCAMHASKKSGRGRRCWLERNLLRHMAEILFRFSLVPGQGYKSHSPKLLFAFWLLTLPPISSGTEGMVFYIDQPPQLRYNNQALWRSGKHHVPFDYLR